MTWLLKNGENSREFSTEEAAKDAKAQLAGLGGTLTIERKESETTDSNEVDANYVEMSYGEMESETDSVPYLPDSDKGCPSCGEDPECSYRCQQCGRDLAGVRVGVGTGGRP